MKVVSIVGARPQFIKSAPVSRAIERHNAQSPERSIQEVLIHTGQHYSFEMSAVFFDELGLKDPDVNLGVGSGTHAYQTGEILKRSEAVLLRERPDWVLVYGDTNSTLGGALAAAKLSIPVAHVEAGLRSFNRRMPEETNRVLTDHVSSLLFCPTEGAMRNLAREGISRGVHLVGDVMYDALLYNIARAARESTILTHLNLNPRGYSLATVHRAENTDDRGRLQSIVRALVSVGRDRPVIWPVHPRTRRAIELVEPVIASGAGAAEQGLRLITPISYLDMLLLEKEAQVILTDSGGVQKEAYLLGVPCVTLREETEWTETVEAGWNVIAGIDQARITEAAARPHRPTTTRPSLFGDGEASGAIVRLLAESGAFQRLEAGHTSDSLIGA